MIMNTIYGALTLYGAWVFVIQLHNPYEAKRPRGLVLTWKCSQTQKPGNQRAVESNFNPSCTLS